MALVQQTVKPKPVRRRADAPQLLYVKRRCHRCRGTGRAACTICSGSGEVLKGRDIFGHLQFMRCSGCFGNKASRCSTCGGEGFC